MMRLLVTVAGMGDRSISVGERATVGSLITALGGAPSQVLTVARNDQILDHDQPLATADLRSGDRIALRGRVQATGVMVGQAPVVLRAMSGPVRGETYDLTYGVTTIGRVSANDITIIDSGMSRQHASISITRSTATITDNFSTNGVIVNDRLVTEPTPLNSGDQLKLGTTVLVVEHRLHATPSVEDEIPAPGPPQHVDLESELDETVQLDPAEQLQPARLTHHATPEFYRRVRSDRPYEGQVIELPVPPLPPSRWRLTATAQADYDAEKAAFLQSLRRIEERLAQQEAREQAGRSLEAPSVSEVEEIASGYGPRLWERTMSDHDALTVRLGTSALPSRNRLALPDDTDSPLYPQVAALAETFRTVADVPATVDITGGLRLVGPTEPVTELASSVLCQLAALHSPAELLCTVLASPDTVQEWEWLKWLPHVQDGSTRLGLAPIASGPDRCEAMGTMLLELINHRRRRQRAGSLAEPSPAVVVLVDEGASVPQPILAEIIKNGPSAHVSLLWVALDDPRPSEPLGATVTIRPTASSADRCHGTLSLPDDEIADIALDLCSASQRDEIVRKLSPIVDKSGSREVDGLTSSRLNLPQMLGTDPTRDNVLARWDLAIPSLRCPIGRTAHNTVKVDLAGDGPHGFVAGDSGSGKTSLLEVWVTSMAASHSPSRLALFLIDSPRDRDGLLKSCGDLPHVVGHLDEPDKAGSALSYLSAEVERRSALVGLSGAASLHELALSGRSNLPPFLVVAVDDLSVWAGLSPDFVNSLVDMADRAGHLGIHLLAASDGSRSELLELAFSAVERAKGIATIRVGLRLADPQVSEALLGTEAAADVSRFNPGRGVLKVGAATPTEFQTAQVCPPVFDAEAVTVSDFTSEGDPLPLLDAPIDTATPRPLCAAINAAATPRT